MKDLVDTTEMYLRTIFELEEEGIPPMRARIAERLGHSGPTVSQTVARMERDELVHVGSDRRLVLTEEGRSVATQVPKVLTKVLNGHLRGFSHSECTLMLSMLQRMLVNGDALREALTQEPAKPPIQMNEAGRDPGD